MKKSMMAASARMAMPQLGTLCSVAPVPDPSGPLGSWVMVFPGFTGELKADVAEMLLLACTVVAEEL